MKWENLFKLIFVLAFILNFFNFVVAIPNPVAVFCVEQGYEYEDDYCIFPDGNKCDASDFYDETCGTEYIKETPCKKEGEYITFSGKTYCCDGLDYLNSNVYFDEVEGCVDPAIIPGSPSICSDCGNDICEEWENACNCPEDCGLVMLAIKDYYEYDEPVEIKVRNYLDQTIYYDASGCGPKDRAYYISKMTGSALVKVNLMSPCSVCPALFFIESIEPDEEKIIDTWDLKTYYESNVCDCEVNPTCIDDYFTDPGDYKVSFKYNTRDLGEFPPNPKETEEIVSKRFTIKTRPQTTTIPTTTIITPTTIPVTTTIPSEKPETDRTLIFYGIVIAGLLIAAGIYFTKKK